MRMQWNLEELERLVADEAHENSRLEFKASDALMNPSEQRARGVLQQGIKDYGAEVSKDISAMANANGGYIIYGITENDANKAEAIDSGHPMTAKKIGWLEQIFATQIKPPINDIKIHAIRLNNNTHEVYVVEVPAANSNAPHQASDKCYYQRINAQNVKLEDYQIRDLMRRDIAPDLLITPTVTEGKWEYPDPQIDHQPIFKFRLNFGIINLSHTPAMYTAFFVFIDARLTAEINSEWTKTENAAQANGVMFHRYQRNWAIPGSLPLFKNCPFGVLDCDVRFNAQPQDKGSFQFPIFWTIHTIGANEHSANTTIQVPAMELPFRT